MLSIDKRTPSETDLFRIPFSGSLSWSDLIEMHPDLPQEMDGQCKENCLSFYYELNPVIQVYEFRDEDSELDFAEILKIDLDVTRDGESQQEKEDREEDEKKRIKLYNDMMTEFMQEDTEIPNHNLCDELTINFKHQKDVSKKAKKERRAQKLLERKKVT